MNTYVTRKGSYDSQNIAVFYVSGTVEVVKIITIKQIGRTVISVSLGKKNSNTNRW